ncbi:hypothetical protein DUNSADRAFT_15816 [Dunaliella salina]|uniref:Uncharacterized protein n=1 Tax=Dunaliella salina TaxID=3046 RepID=A0ABQ7H1I7_DUNSA|nr:hypothetical protein DUNSADRAFT_15816 [Dunaliella salina]|eukprot:KAF5840721.1 hypothetical protein DUNSADRAFT_15816 [Dunaliella salina]
MFSMATHQRSVSCACGQYHSASLVLVASRRTCINARRVAKASRRAKQLVDRSNITTPHALPCQPVTPPSAALQRQTSLQEEVQEVCGDYFAALRAYRQMQAELGPKAAQAVRQLSNNRSLLTYDAAARVALYDEVVGTLEGVTREQLAELVSLRRRLLHELPRVKAQVTEIVGEQSMGNKRGAGATHFRKSDGTNCNSLYTLEVVPNSVKQWVRSKEYSMRKARSNSTTMSEGAASGREEAPLTGLHQQQQSYHPMGNQAPIPPSIAAAIPQQNRMRTPSGIVRSQALQAALQQQQQGQGNQPSPMANGRTGEQHLVAEQEDGASISLQQAHGFDPSSDSGHGPGHRAFPSAEPDGSMSAQHSTLPATSAAGQAEQPGSATQGSSGGSNYLDQSVQLSASSSRLRAAALAAAKYRQSKQGKKGDEAGSSSGSRAPSAAGGEQQPQQQQQPAVVAGAVEVGNRQAVYTAPRRSRANAEEASLLICP